MKKKPGFELRDVCGAPIIISTGVENIDFSKLISLNETSAFIWKSMPADREFTIDELVEKVIAEYEVSAEQAREDIIALTKQLIDNEVIDC